MGNAEKVFLLINGGRESGPEARGQTRKVIVLAAPHRGRWRVMVDVVTVWSEEIRSRRRRYYSGVQCKYSFYSFAVRSGSRWC